MIILKVNQKYTWVNPYTNALKIGVIIAVDTINEMMTVKTDNKIYHIGS